MNIDELKYNFEKFSDREKLDFLAEAEKELSVRITNDILTNHLMFVSLFAMIGTSLGYAGAKEYWERYWKRSQTPDYAHPAFLGLFIEEVRFRSESEEALKKDLESL